MLHTVRIGIHNAMGIHVYPCALATARLLGVSKAGAAERVLTIQELDSIPGRQRHAKQPGN